MTGATFCFSAVTVTSEFLSPMPLSSVAELAGSRYPLAIDHELVAVFAGLERHIDEKFAFFVRPG